MKLFYSIFLFILLITPATLFSQKFEGGMLGGLVTSQVDGDRFGGYHKLGFTFGCFVNREISDRTGWQMEIKYIQKGSRQDVNTSGGKYMFYRMMLHYVEVPWIFHYYFKDRITFEAGIATGYLAKGTDEDEYGVFESTREFKLYEISCLGGVAYEISEKFTGVIRGAYSILPIRNHPGDQSYWLDMGQYNNLLSATLYFNFGRR